MVFLIKNLSDMHVCMLWSFYKLNKSRKSVSKFASLLSDPGYILPLPLKENYITNISFIHDFR